MKLKSLRQFYLILWNFSFWRICRIRPWTPLNLKLNFAQFIFICKNGWFIVLFHLHLQFAQLRLCSTLILVAWEVIVWLFGFYFLWWHIAIPLLLIRSASLLPLVVDRFDGEVVSSTVVEQFECLIVLFPCCSSMIIRHSWLGFFIITFRHLSCN